VATPTQRRNKAMMTPMNSLNKEVLPRLTARAYFDESGEISAS
jgi:hypothetical protein